MQTDKRYLILLINSDNKAVLVGDENGDSMKFEEADKWAQRYEGVPGNRYQVLTMPVTPLGMNNVPLGYTVERRKKLKVGK